MDYGDRGCANCGRSRINLGPTTWRKCSDRDSGSIDRVAWIEKLHVISAGASAIASAALSGYLSCPVLPVIIDAHESRFMSIPTAVTPFGVGLQSQIPEFIGLNNIPVDVTELEGLPLLLQRCIQWSWLGRID
jgi:hypothetical protein